MLNSNQRFKIWPCSRLSGIEY